MKDKVVWVKKHVKLQDGSERNCFVRHFSVPFEGLIIDADTWFSATAYINKNKKRIMGFYTGPDDTGDGIDRFIEYVNQGVK